VNQTCDDCGQDYPGPVYYSFDPEACVSTREWVQEGARVEPPISVGSGNVTEDDLIPHGDDCTGNLCPACAGPHLEPDDEADPRRPKEA
jgi:hypothetical protein